MEQVEVDLIRRVHVSESVCSGPLQSLIKGPVPVLRLSYRDRSSFQKVLGKKFALVGVKSFWIAIQHVVRYLTSCWSFETRLNLESMAEDPENFSHEVL